MHNIENCLFQKADERVLTHMKERIGKRLPTFLAPINLVLQESVQVAYMLNQIINSFKKGRLYKTFFCNSHMEAVHGAIKIARHYAKTKDNLYNGGVLFFDPTDYFRSYFNPNKLSDEEAIVPGIEIIEDFDDIIKRLKNKNFKIIIASVDEFKDEEFDAICEYCEKNDIITILNLSRVRLFSNILVRRLLINRFHIVCWGEVFTNYHIPFGAFSTRKDIYDIWNNISNCLTHSSTFGGNGMVLSYVIKNIHSWFSIFSTNPEYQAFFTKVTQSSRAKLKASRTYLNAYSPIVLRHSNSDFHLAKAEGSFLFMKGNKKLDCVGGSGCNVLGHNRQDMIVDVLEKHDTLFDYSLVLNKKLYEITGLQRMFQTVSGASAVELGIIISLLASDTRKKILVFNGNFGGRTLVALNATADNHFSFNPLYAHVQVFDPNSANCLPELEKILTSGKIGLVWMEIIQGRSSLPIPPEVITMIEAHKDKHKYYIGIDEILNGVYRTGEFTSFDSKKIRPDIIAFGKGLSGMVLPISLIMFSSELYKRASHKNEAVVNHLENLYKNQLSCHTAMYVMDNLITEDIKTNVKEISGYLHDGVNNIMQKTKLLKSVRMYGLHMRVYVNMKMFPFNFFGFDRSNAVLSHLFYSKGNFLSFFGRMLPPLNLKKEDALQIIEGMEKVFAYSPMYFFWIGVKQGIYKRWQILLNKFSIY